MVAIGANWTPRRVVGYFGLVMEPAEAEVLFGRRLRQRREQVGLSTRVLAERMQERGFEWNHNTVLKTEAAKRPVRLIEALTLSSILEIYLGSLLQPELDEEKRGLREELTLLSARQMEVIDRARRLETAFEEAQADVDKAIDDRQRLRDAYQTAIAEVKELNKQITELNAVLSDPNPPAAGGS
jgi:transcriptional regulator with XRE-family HTH domain